MMVLNNIYIFNMKLFKEEILKISLEYGNFKLGGEILYAVLAMIIILILIHILVIVIPRYLLFKKAGVPGWESFIPFHRQIVLLKMARCPELLIFVNLTIIGIPFYYLYLHFKLVKSFNKNTQYAVLTIPFVRYLFLGYGDARYIEESKSERFDKENVKYKENITQTMQLEEVEITEEKPVMTMAVEEKVVIEEPKEEAKEEVVEQEELPNVEIEVPEEEEEEIAPDLGISVKEFIAQEDDGKVIEEIEEDVLEEVEEDGIQEEEGIPLIKEEIVEDKPELEENTIVEEKPELEFENKETFMKEEEIVETPIVEAEAENIFTEQTPIEEEIIEAPIVESPVEEQLIEKPVEEQLISTPVEETPIINNLEEVQMETSNFNQTNIDPLSPLENIVSSVENLIPQVEEEPIVENVVSSKFISAVPIQNEEPSEEKPEEKKDNDLSVFGV